MDLSHHLVDPCRERCEKLIGSLDGTAALIAAGGAVSRNYPAATYPYRAASHFLYLVGLPLADAFALLDGGGCTLFLPTPGAQDALWHGATPGPAEIAELTGCNVRSLDQLADALGGRTVATLPAPDAATRAKQSALLGREVQPGEFVGEDGTLARAMVSSRLVHDEAAIDGLRRAADATVAAHRAGMAATRPGRTEAEVRAAMEATLMGRGMGTSYGSIVTVHGEILHNEMHHHTIADGDLLLADVGAETADGWAGDVTRTWPVSGVFSTTQRELYEVVLAAERAAIDAVRPGARYRDIHLLAARTLTSGLIELGILRGDAEELVADGVHALLFPHGVGHLLGLDVHDMEDLGDLAGYAADRERADQFGLSYLRLDRDLEPGMAVTIEPGFYQVPAILADPKLRAIAGDRLDESALARFGDVRGIRIEDDVLVTTDGHEVLTAPLEKDADAVERLVGRPGS